MSFDTIVRYNKGPYMTRDPFTHQGGIETSLFIGHLCSHPAAPEAITVIPLKTFLWNAKYSKLDPPSHFNASTEQFSIIFRSAFTILNDRKTIIAALVEERILSKDAIEAFADDVPPRVQEPVRDNRMDAPKIRAGGYIIAGTLVSPYVATPGYNDRQREQYQILHNQYIGQQWLYQRGNGG